MSICFTTSIRNDNSKAVEVLSKLIANAQSIEIECRASIGNSAELKWLSIFAKSEWNEERNRVAIIYGAVRDVTKQREAEAELRESEKKYRVLFDSDMFAVHVFDMETLEIIDVNERHTSLYGYNREELTSGMTVLNLTAEEKESKKIIEQIRSTGTVYVPLRYHRKKDGSIFPAAFANASYVWKGRKVCIASIRDISERKRAEDEQARVHNLLAVSQRIAHIGSWEYERSTQKISLSDEMYRIAGIPVGSPITLALAESFLPANEFRRSRNAIDASIQRGVPYVIDYQIQRSDGQLRTVHSEAEVVFNEAGEPVRVFGTSQDITKRKAAEESLRASEQITEGILDAIPAGVFWKDAHSIYLGCNMRFARDAGFDDPSYIIGKNDYEVGFPKECAERYREIDREVIQTGSAILNFEDSVMRNEEEVTDLATIVPLRNEKDEINGVLGTYIEITERKRVEKALEENEKRLLASGSEV